MKVSCNHCGTRNELGRIFCMSCGKRMHITNDDVSQAADDKRAFDVRALVRTVFLLILLSLVLVALWPRKPVVLALASGKKAEVRAKLAGKINSLVSAARGKRAASAVFDSDELGVYLEARRGSSATNPPALSVRLEGSRMIVLQHMVLGPFVLGGKPLGPFRLTRELSCEAVGRVFKASDGWFGHFPLPGPLKAVVIDPVVSAFVLTPAEQAIEKQLSGMTIQDGKLELVVGP